MGMDADACVLFIFDLLTDLSPDPPDLLELLIKKGGKGSLSIFTLIFIPFSSISLFFKALNLS